MKTTNAKTMHPLLRKIGPLLGCIVFYVVIMLLRRADIINGYYMQVMLFAGVNVLMTASLNLVNGFTGQFCIGHAGFMSLGAYGRCHYDDGVKVTDSGGGTDSCISLGLLCGGIVAAIVGILIGIPSLKLKGTVGHRDVALARLSARYCV